MKEEILTRNDWIYLIRLLSSAGGIFAHGPSDVEVLNRILWKTVWFHKMEDSFLVPALTRGDLRIAWFPSRYSRQAAHQSLAKLTRNNVLTTRRTGRVTSEWWIRVEAASMLCCMTQLYPEQSVLINLREKLISYWNQENWEMPDIPVPKEVVVNLKESVEIGKRRNAEAKLRMILKRQVKRASIENDELRARHVFEIMRDTCTQLGIRYAETLLSKKEQGKAKGSAWNFLKYCEENKINPRLLLYDVCANWSRMRTGSLISSEGKPLHLTSVVSFLDFYRYRSEIVRWIEENRSTRTAWEVEVIEE